MENYSDKLIYHSRLFTMQESDLRELFQRLYAAGTEAEVEAVVQSRAEVFNNSQNWQPLGNNDNNYGIVENQQANPVAALIEKITNSIDAVLTKKCLEQGIDPKSKEAPQSMMAAREKFFPEHKNWDLPKDRNKQAENIQILADGEKKNTSLIIYDDGEGQHPHNFENTFLSLVRGNKNEIQFVQGKYNMGGSGAIVFCGKKRYQLIGSKKYDNSGKFGFTLIRKHPMTTSEETSKKSTWYEYLKIDDAIPAFELDSLDLNLYKRPFTTGTIIKLYSYKLQKISDISRDLNSSINEYLFEPVLPVYTIEKKERYPKSSLRRGLYGLKRKLEGENNEYVEDTFSLILSDSLIGTAKITCYVFKTIVDDKSAKESKETIRREFFKNNMAVLFSINGQVHSHFTNEFISRSLKMNLLKDYLLIHVDCTEIKREFRDELFMASRDRLKGSEESNQLRKLLKDKISEDGRLKEISERRKASIALGSEDNAELIKSAANNLPWDAELAKLCGQALSSDKIKSKAEKNMPPSSRKKTTKIDQPFSPQRFPAQFKRRQRGNTDVVTVTRGGKNIIYFDTDVANNYFDRVEEPGSMDVGLLDFSANESDGGCTAGKADKIEDIFTVTKSSPQEGSIKLHLSPNKKLKVGNEAKIKVSLSSPNAPEGQFDEIFWVKVGEPTAKPQKTQKKIDNVARDDLPAPIEVYEDSSDEAKMSWAKLNDQGIEMDYNKVVHLFIDNEKLEKIYINMDSSVFKKFNHKDKNPSEEKLKSNKENYLMTVYCHALFMFAITKKEGVTMLKEKNQAQNSMEIDEYIENLFSNHKAQYAEFLLNFNEWKLRQLSDD